MGCFWGKATLSQFVMLILSISFISKSLANQPPLVEPTQIGSLKGEPVALPDLKGIVKNKPEDNY